MPRRGLSLLKHEYFVFTANQWRNDLSKAFSAPLSISVLFITDFQSKIEDKGVSRVGRRLLLLVVVQTVLTLLIEAGKPSLAYPRKNIARKYGYQNMEKTIHLLV